VDPGEPFHMTYGDGLSDVDLRALCEFHQEASKDCHSGQPSWLKVASARSRYP